MHDSTRGCTVIAHESALAYGPRVCLQHTRVQYLLVLVDLRGTCGNKCMPAEARWDMCHGRVEGHASACRHARMCAHASCGGCDVNARGYLV